MVKKGTIVIIDDDEEDVELILQIVDDYIGGNHSIAFANGRIALDYLYKTREQPFIIISDINMPVMNGLELYEHIYKDEYLRLKSIPFVFLTTSSNPFEIKKAYELTVQGYFKKPNKLEDLRRTVERIIDYWAICLHPNMI
jgi:CheY-like chemotaxis protein